MDFHNELFASVEFRETLRTGARESHSPGHVDAPSLDALRESGLLGMMVSKDYGGWGWEAEAANAVIEDVATVSPSIAIMLYLHCAVVVRIQEYGTDAQKELWFPRIVQHNWLAASAWSEPGSAADKRSLSTTAQRHPAGGWQVTGGKTFSTGATVAEFFIVLVQLPAQADVARPAGATYGGSNQAIFLIEADAAGVHVPQLALDMSGMRGSGTGMVQFQEVRLQDLDMLCEGDATSEAIQLPHRLGLTLGAVSVGAAQAAYDVAVDHLRSRNALDDRLLRRQLASNAVAIEAARSMVGNLTTGAEAERVLRAYAVKVFVSTTGQTVCANVRSLLGSAGYLRGHEINRISQDAEAVMHMGPPNHLCIDLIAARLPNVES